MAAHSFNSSGKSRPWRWWRLQFGLRSLFGLTLMACLLMGCWRWYGWTYERQYAAQQKLAPHATLIEMEAASPAWLRPLYKKEIFRDVVLVKFAGGGAWIDEELSALALFPRLRELSFDNTNISDSGLAHVADLSELESLSLHHTPVTNAGLAHLRGLKKLKRLELGHTEIDGAGLAHLRWLKNLEFLELDGLRIEDEHLASLAELAELKTLRLNETLIRGPGLKTLSQLPRLVNLSVTGERLEAVNVHGFAALEDLYCSTPSNKNTRYAVRDCPRLASLDVVGEFDSLDLRNLPRLARFVNVGGLRRFGRRGPELHDKTEPSNVTMILHDMTGLGELRVAVVGKLSLDLTLTPALRVMHVDSNGLQEMQCSDVPLLEELHFDFSRATGPSVIPLEQFENVRRLRVTSHLASLQQLPSLGDLQNLEELVILGGQLNGPELERVVRCGRLKSLEFGTVHPPSGALRSLRGLQSLEQLQLALQGFDNQDLASLGTLYNLRSLTVRSMSLREEGLVHLLCLPNLKSVDLLAPNVFLDSVERLSLALPADCKVTHHPGGGHPSVFQHGERID